MPGNTKGLRCKEGVLDGQTRLRCLCPDSLCNDHVNGDGVDLDAGTFTNFQIVQISLVILTGLFLLTCLVCSCHQINNHV